MPLRTPGGVRSGVREKKHAKPTDRPNGRFRRNKERNHLFTWNMFLANVLRLITPGALSCRY